MTNESIPGLSPADPLKDLQTLLSPPPLHTTQSTKQAVVWRCPNAECRESPLEKYYEWEGDYPECPKCGQGPPAVHKRVLIHLLLPDKNGRIIGHHGRRWRVACTPQRSHLATHTNGEAATGDVLAANCPGCLAAVGEKLRSFGS